MNEFEELVDQHYAALYRFGFSLAKNAEQASDLVQHVFCVWAEKGDQLKDRSKAKTWLFTTLYREFLSQRRKGKRFVSSDAVEFEPAEASQQSTVARGLDAKRAVSLLGELEESYRAPLILFYLQQHSYREIAEILEIPIGTVMSRLSRAKEQLKDLMAKPSRQDNIVSFQPQRKQK